MSSIRATIGSSNSIPMERCWRVGAARVMVPANLTIQRQPQSIRRPTKFMSPIRAINGYRSLIRLGSLTKWSMPEWGQPVGFEDLAIDSQTGRLYASSTHLDTVLVFDL